MTTASAAGAAAAVAEVAAASASAAAASTAARISVPELTCVVSFVYLVGSFVTFWAAARSAAAGGAGVGSPQTTSSSSSSSFSSWAVTFTQSHLPLVPLCVAYLALLAASWSPDTLSLMMPGSIEEGLAEGFKPQFFPQLDGIMELLSRRATTASAWLHIACINFFVGRHAAGCPTVLQRLALLSRRHTPVFIFERRLLKQLEVKPSIFFVSYINTGW